MPWSDRKTNQRAKTCESDVINKARKRGAIDFVGGVVVGDNPYDEEDDAKHWAWIEGWSGAGLAALRKMT